MRVKPNPGYAKLAARKRCITIAAPTLASGSRGPSVRFLERRLARLHYLLLNRNGSFGADTRDAVYAFQKIEGLARTGVVGRSMWNELPARTPRAPRAAAPTSRSTSAARCSSRSTAAASSTS